MKILKHAITFVLILVCNESVAKDDRVDFQVSSKNDCVAKLGSDKDSASSCEKIDEMCVMFPNLIASIEFGKNERRFRKLSIDCSKYKT
ncbi:MAG: hypothetical protein HWE26_06775 [Alteromonadaceae bacterium]|nr:hypothetical protein [Alteromonadaceae bacterium]